MNRTFVIQEVASLDQPGLWTYRTLRRPVEHAREGFFVAEGEKVVRRLLRSSLSVVSLLVTHEWFERLISDGLVDVAELARPVSPSDLPNAYLAEHSLLNEIVGFKLHQGIMGVGRVPISWRLEQAVAQANQPHLFVALDGLVNAENVGLVVRNAAAFGVDGIIVGETSSSPYLRRAVRNSMGTVFEMPVVHSTDLTHDLCAMRQLYRTRIIAAHPGEAQTIHDADFSGNICLVFGNEGEGISDQILKVADSAVAIPMHRGTDSLNVASASAVFLYEARKQKTAGNKE